MSIKSNNKINIRTAYLWLLEHSFRCYIIKARVKILGRGTEFPISKYTGWLCQMMFVLRRMEWGRKHSKNKRGRGWTRSGARRARGRRIGDDFHVGEIKGGIWVASKISGTFRAVLGVSE